MELEQSGVSPSVFHEVSDPMASMSLSLRAFWKLQGLDFMVAMAVMAVMARGNCCPL
jgi:hypothetical protein